MRGKKLKFIDLFAGLGGFHVALEKLGCECVFASELKEELAHLYKENFGIIPNRDINKIAVEDIPAHDILTAGFPCQPFSKAGAQKGFEDEKNGSLFDRTVEILSHHRPDYFILENVGHLFFHNNGKTWEYIKNRLEKELNYSIAQKIFSPHNFGIPQHRERIFIVGARNGISHFSWPKPIDGQTNVFDLLDVNPVHATKLEGGKVYVLDLWQEFLDRLPKETKIPGVPIWAMEFGATYPFEKKTPFASSTRRIGATRGNFGISLKGMSREEKFAHLPKYARTEQQEFPGWKKRYIRINRSFYETNKKYIDPVVKKIKELEVPSWQKFEWNVGGSERDLKKYIIQFRGSGVRVKKTDFFPSLVTSSSQMPVLGWEQRYITPEEGARLQSIEGIRLPKSNATCFHALGNAVNVDIVSKIASNLIVI